MEILKVENLSKKYLIKKKFLKKEYFKAVDNVSFEINQGEVVGLVGESGSGKSTIGKLILKLIKSDEGKIYFKGKDINQIKEKEFRRETSIIFQDPRNSLNPRYKIYDILEEPLIVHKEKDRKEKIIKAITDAGLDESFLNRYPSELSGGQRQRVAIARAIILNPSLIVADEPTSALDISVATGIVKLLKNLKENRNVSFLFISHDLNVVSSISDKIIVLYKGKIMEKGKTEDIIDNPMHPYTKLLLESLPPETPRKRKKIKYIEEIETPEGSCIFYGKCPNRTDICKKEPDIKFINNREVYCHFV